MTHSADSFATLLVAAEDALQLGIGRGVALAIARRAGHLTPRQVIDALCTRYDQYSLQTAPLDRLLAPISVAQQLDERTNALHAMVADHAQQIETDLLQILMNLTQIGETCPDERQLETIALGCVAGMTPERFADAIMTLERHGWIGRKRVSQPAISYVYALFPELSPLAIDRWKNRDEHRQRVTETLINWIIDHPDAFPEQKRLQLPGGERALDTLWDISTLRERAVFAILGLTDDSSDALDQYAVILADSGKRNVAEDTLRRRDRHYASSMIAWGHLADAAVASGDFPQFHRCFQQLDPPSKWDAIGRAAYKLKDDHTTLQRMAEYIHQFEPLSLRALASALNIFRDKTGPPLPTLDWIRVVANIECEASHDARTDAKERQEFATLYSSLSGSSEG